MGGHSRSRMGKFTAVAAATLTTMLRGAEPAMPRSTAEIPLPPVIRDLPRRKRLKVLRKAEARAANERNRLANRRERREARHYPHPNDRERVALVAGMTNWQLTRWQRAGSPKDLERVRHFASLEHWKSAGAST